MIQFKILDSNDFTAIGFYEFHFNMIYLGRKAEHLSINDPDLRENHLIIESIEDYLVVHPQKEVENFLLNQKRASGLKKIKIHDVIQIGSTKIEILDFKFEEVPTKKKILDEKFKHLMTQDSPLLPIIEDLSKQGLK